MKKLVALLLVAAMALGCCGSAFAVNEDITGDVMIYTSMYQFVIDMMFDAIKAEFPNLNAKTAADMFFYAGTGSLQTKIAGEMETGSLGCDMMLVAEPAYSLELKEGGWLEPVEIENADKLFRFDYDKDGYWYPVRVCNMVLAYNTEKYTPDQLPKTFHDFAYDTSLKGQISMGNPLTSGTTMAAAAALSDKYGYDYFTALGNNNVMIESGSTAIEKLNSGECKVIMILEESILQRQKEYGQTNLGIIYPEDGVILIPSTVMTVAEDKSANMNLEACEAITNWLMSEEAQQLIMQGYMHSVLAGEKDIPFNSVSTDDLIQKDMGVDWERCYTQREEIRTQFQERVTVK